MPGTQMGMESNKLMTYVPRQTDDQMKHEAACLCKLYLEQPHMLLVLLSTQLGVLKQQAQTFMGLCGLAITVTGFSGAHMIRAGAIASFSLSARLRIASSAPLSASKPSFCIIETESVIIASHGFICSKADIGRP